MFYTSNEQLSYDLFSHVIPELGYIWCMVKQTAKASTNGYINVQICYITSLSVDGHSKHVLV